MKQKQAIKILKQGHNAFITGAAGSGKTFLAKKFISWAKAKGKAVAITASTGIAATHLNGITVHSWSGIKVHKTLSDSEIRKMMQRDYLREHIMQSDILVIDEISMLHAFQFDLINKVCKLFRQDARPFGGLQVVISGDFFQLPPVVRSGDGPGHQNFVVNSAAWSELELNVCYLTEQYRHQDSQFLTLLNNIRQQKYDAADIELLKSRIGAELYSDVQPVKIYTHNVDVDSINSMELSEINKKPVTHWMESSGLSHLVRQLQNNCLAPEELVLKKGAVVMFVKNKFDAGYINGTMGVVEDFDENLYPIVKTAEGNTIHVRPASWTVNEQNEVVAEIKQLPLRLAWAITVHKSQGMSLDLTEVDLSKSFGYGMGYVALSRVRSLEGLRLLGFNKTALRVDPKVIELNKTFIHESNKIGKVSYYSSKFYK
ncbi:AAA family ATPase [Patescibacteria group bacterium]|nr:AAA family ATPase [Patescibacteria group bacterium]